MMQRDSGAKVRSGWVIIPDWTRSRSIGHVMDAKGRSRRKTIPGWTRSRSIGYVADARLGRINSAYLAKRRHTQTVLPGMVFLLELYIRMIFSLNVIGCGRWKY